MSDPVEGQYAKMRVTGTIWKILEWKESSWNHHEGYWVEKATVEDESDADKIVRCRNKSLESPDNPTDSIGGE